MTQTENGLDFPRLLTDDMSLEATFEGRFREYFQPLGVSTIGELRRVPKADLSHDATCALNAWLLRCWWFR